MQPTFKLMCSVVGTCVSLSVQSEVRASEAAPNTPDPYYYTTDPDSELPQPVAAAVELTVPADANASANSLESGPTRSEYVGAGVDAGTSAPATQGAELDPVALNAFRSELDPYGAWYDDPNYGRVWVPNPAYVGGSFSPYVTNGQWGLDADDNWMWMSDFPFGSVVYHYGRWANIDGLGWSWIPGAVYSPAWVVWRVPVDGYAYIGWAPAPPVYGWFTSGAAWLAYNRPTPFVFCPSRYAFYPHFGAQLVRDRLFAEQLVHHSIWNAHTSSYARSMTSPTLSRASVPQSAIPIQRTAAQPHVLRSGSSWSMSRPGGSSMMPPQAGHNAVWPQTRGPGAPPAGPRTIGRATVGLFESTQPRHTIRLGTGALPVPRQGLPLTAGYTDRRIYPRAQNDATATGAYGSQAFGTTHSGLQVLPGTAPSASRYAMPTNRARLPVTNGAPFSPWTARQIGNPIGSNRSRASWSATPAATPVPRTSPPPRDFVRPSDLTRATPPFAAAPNHGFSGGGGFRNSSPPTRSFGGASFGARSNSGGVSSPSPAMRSFGNASAGSGSFGARSGGSGFHGSSPPAGRSFGGGSFGARGGGGGGRRR